jgi:RNA polymerase sigma-70 factor (ECF subfamily)
MTQEGRSGLDEEALRHSLLLGLDGDVAAYHAFLKALSAHLRAYFRKRLTRMPDEVEDLVQETLLAIHNQRHTYDSDLPVTAWVHAIAKYKLIDLLRRRAAKDALHDPLDDAAESLTAADTEVTETRRDLTNLLARLPDRFRLPIVHTKLEGRSVAEAAQAIGMSESAVKVGVHRGLKALAALVRGES